MSYSLRLALTRTTTAHVITIIILIYESLLFIYVLIKL